MRARPAWLTAPGSWLRDDSVRRAEDLPEPADLATQILAQLSVAAEEMQELARLLGESAG